MRDPASRTIRLAEYTPPAYLVDTVAIDVDIARPWATVRATLAMRRNPEGAGGPLLLDGAHHELLSVALDGAALDEGRYAVAEGKLRVAEVPESFTLETVVRFDPWKNTRLEGFYASKDGLFTQCEAEGFRCITWFPDRPDVMATYRVTLHAAKDEFPHLLANGNLVESADEDGGRHRATWEDPFPKPCYLFAMVAAKLDLHEDHFTTRSGRKALLQVYVEPGKLDQAGFAMQCLKRANFPLANSQKFGQIDLFVRSRNLRANLFPPKVMDGQIQKENERFKLRQRGRFSPVLIRAEHAGFYADGLRAFRYGAARGKPRIAYQHADFFRTNRDLGFAIHGSSTVLPRL